MKNKLITGITIFLISATAHAQTDADILRFSMLNYGSTARSLGMGNSFGALGADFSTLAINPAGIALYRKSEFSVSPLFSNRNINSEYIKNNTSDNYFKFAFGNLGMVWAGSRDKESSPWKGFAFGIGYNKTNDFSSRYIAEAGNAKNSLLDNYMEQLNGVDPDDIPSFYPFDIDLAWQTYLLDTIDDAGTPYYYSALPFAGALQRKTVETRGGQGEWDFTFGGNYEDMFFFGLTLGVTTLRYFEESTWEESDDQDTIPFFESYQYNQTLETSGSGINIKAGFIFKPADAFRLGLAIHSPTWHSLVDEYSTSIKTDLEDGVIRDYTGPVFVPFDYNITTPFRVITSMGIIIGKQMAFNVDYEFLDYSQGRIRPVNKSFSSDFTPVNKAMRSKYTASHNLRAGLEWRFEQLRFRAGGYYSTSPFESALRVSEKTDLSRYGITGGLGFREKKYYVDLAYAWSKSGSYLLPYSLNNQTTEGITFSQTDNRVLITVGFLF
ncbi:MAG: outer membrane protein transport protein [Bacteroidetes bacterium]|nr:outer membrane protein transport protein [Bacteroidota bacterium]